MSPNHRESKLNIERVAIIGGGPCGLAAAKYLAAEKRFSEIEVFEQRSSVGGVWNYTSLTVVDNDFTIPRTRPTKLPDTAVRTDDAPEAQFVSPVYDLLETNIPCSLMAFSDQKFPEDSSLFPRHEVVKKYLEDYARELRPMLSLCTQVLKVEKVRGDTQMYWQLELLDLSTGKTRSKTFDAVVVASGHYNDPFIPDIKGLHEFARVHAGCVSHSKFYRRASEYQNKKVVIVGNSASGVDISAQISSVCQLPIIISEKTIPTSAVEEKPWARFAPEIAEFLPGERAVKFTDGSIERCTDAVVFCTGYFYSFPFLKTLSPAVVTDGSNARHLYEHVLYIDDPTLGFLGIPQRVVPFPIAEAQAAYVARIWAERLDLPPHADMEEWERNLLKSKGDGRSLHNMAFPQDVEYINGLHSKSSAARKVAGLENDGAGKLAPFWGPDKAWVRARMPLIKIASRALGAKRHEVKRLEDLGFDYESWKAAMETEQDLL
ncbi:putative flavin dependent monooxygenase [Xylariaceae sp. FL0804]|nr:putative flavin dependent monooxygenase [Xylariaceae sp. FL0804]